LLPVFVSLSKLLSFAEAFVSCRAISSIQIEFNCMPATHVEISLMLLPDRVNFGQSFWTFSCCFRMLHINRHQPTVAFVVFVVSLKEIRKLDGRQRKQGQDMAVGIAGLALHNR